MVELESQEQYLQSIKKIKQIEDKTQKELEDYKKNSETKIKNLLIKVFKKQKKQLILKLTS